MTTGLYRCVYRSDSLIDHQDVVALDSIFTTSTRNNRRDRLTGALALPDGKFVQVIEGKRALVDALMLRLRGDDRHENVTVLGEWAVRARLFAGWSMARPDVRRLDAQEFRIVTEAGSGAAVTAVLIAIAEGSVAALY